MEASPQTTGSGFGATAGLGDVIAIPTPLTTRSTAHSLRMFLWRGLFFPLKLFWGMAFCQGLVGSIMVVGWVNRWTQRSALKYWWKCRADAARRIELTEFLKGADPEPDHRHWPNWFVDSRFVAKLKSYRSTSPALYVGSVLKAAFGSVALNFRVGFRAALNTALLIVPAGILWRVRWSARWCNLFDKTSVEIVVGPLRFHIRIPMVIAAELVV